MPEWPYYNIMAISGISDFLPPKDRAGINSVLWFGQNHVVKRKCDRFLGRKSRSYNILSGSNSVADNFLLWTGGG